MSRRTILVSILILAAALRLIVLSNGDPISDEVLYAFRAIKLVDFDEAAHQTTPVEWFDPATKSSATTGQGGANTTVPEAYRLGTPVQPWWLSLSFHDHPPLVFWVQHIFIKIFGENVIAMRLPSAMFGIASVYLLYLIGSLLFTARVGLIAAAIEAVTLNAVYVSRVGLQEGYVIFLLLLTSFFFLKALGVSRVIPGLTRNPVPQILDSRIASFAEVATKAERGNDNYFLWAGVAFGFGLLAKYTAGIAAPIVGTYLLIFRRDVLAKKQLWFGILLALVIFSPVIIYNIKLYQAVGHFDFQISAMLGENPAVWQVQPGKEIGTLADRVKNFIPRLIATNSWLYLLGVLAAIDAFVVLLIMRGRKNIPYGANCWFLAGAIFWLTLLMLKIGPSYRFLAMLTPFLVLAVAVLFNGILKIFQQKLLTTHYSLFTTSALAAFMLFETAYTVNNQLLNYPLGPDPWTASKVRYENYNWGYNALGDYLDKELAGKAPAITFDVQYKFLEKLRDSALADATANGAQLYPAFFVYDGNFDDGGKLWELSRLHIYHGWPIISADEYSADLAEHGNNYFKQVGFRNYYFIFMNNKIITNPDVKALMQGAAVDVIKNKRGDEVFKVYVGEL